MSWNHNIHYHPIVLSAIPPGAQRALDVGCGEGHLTRRLRQLVPEVVGIDQHRESIELARQRDPDGKIQYLHADFLHHKFEAGSFDLVTSVAAVHHMPAARALERMSALLRPGGALAVIGLARSRLPADLPRELAACVVNWSHRITKAYWEQSSPVVWPPPETYRSMRAIAAQLLPGSRFRRHLLWRYSLIWTKPGFSAQEPGVPQ